MEKTIANCPDCGAELEATDITSDGHTWIIYARCPDCEVPFDIYVEKVGKPIRAGS